MDAAVIDEDVVHFEVSALGILALLELDERILQRITRLLVADDFAAEDLAKAGEDELEVFACRDGVELADEEDVLGRGDVGEGQVADHLEREGLSARIPFSSLLSNLLLVA